MKAARRLPVYFLLDCSESMIGDPIRSVREGLQVMIRQLQTSRRTLDTVCVSLITFNSRADQILPLTPVGEVRVPELTIRPGTSFAHALMLLRESIQSEVEKPTETTPGDFRPLVFLLTDGQPTDGQIFLNEAIHLLTNPRIANFYAIGCGRDIDFDLLCKVADAAFRLADVTPDLLQRLFVWLSDSVQEAGESADALQGDYSAIDLTQIPSELTEVMPGTIPRPTGPPMQVFLKSYCIETRLPNLMRFRYSAKEDGYLPVSSHPLDAMVDDEDEPSGLHLPGINASKLLGSPACPFCGNDMFAVCMCESLMCLPDPMPQMVRCPKCDNDMPLLADENDFPVRQSAG